MTCFIIGANIVDIENRRIFSAEISIENGVIKNINENQFTYNNFIIPGFVDSHVHIESSLLVPSEFARMAVTHGTVATVSDPHEIANVLGLHGVNFMVENGKRVPFHFFFGAPSCVPATNFETAGAVLRSEEVDELLQRPEIFYLAEMMNFPGVLNDDAEVIAKLESAKRHNKPVDGHAPGLTGAMALNYINHGISTDHECYTLEEAEEKISYGMRVLIREGSAARNFETLIPLMENFSKDIMFCSDDKHPDSLLEGHINKLAAIAVEKGYDLFDVLKVACLNPISHYKLPLGTLKIGDAADFIVVSDLTDFKCLKTFIKGQLVFDSGVTLINSVEVDNINNFNIEKKTVADFYIEIKSEEFVIECMEGQLITNKIKLKREDIKPENDILKIAVINRYFEATIATAFIKNFGLKKGAIAGSVGHDSHNIIAVGLNDEEICNAVNLIIENKGGLSAVNGADQKLLALPVAGLMSASDAWEVAAKYTELDKFSKDELGSELKAPFMSLSFMALLVIPHLKLSDKGLFDGDSFEFV